ncbi:MAG: hypothetical protein BGO59_31920 [Spirosoma sp. 48-14]|nr:MAG: hypothetical protein BGO59_31920 [Spirosoma sp. 48-14]
MYIYSLNRLPTLFLFSLLAFLLISGPTMAQLAPYTTTGLYSFTTVPAGGPFMVQIIAEGADGATDPDGLGKGRSGASVAGSFTLLTGDMVTSIVGQVVGAEVWMVRGKRWSL